ncbi:MAG: hypothetical protein R3266_07665, partial [Gemmatimonadota bacterium]|nr:hypothetical protein [Gemmatimonadota bacterium]
RPELELVGRYRSGPSKFDVSTRVSWYLSERLRIGVAAGRATRTNEGWIRPTWYNSLAHVVAGDDARDYHRSDRAAAELEWISPEPPLWEDAPAWSFTLSGGWEEARSLKARDVWVLFGESPFDACPDCAFMPTAVHEPEPNPAIDDGDLVFGRAGFTWSLRTREGRLSWGIGLEAGFDDGLGTAADDLDFLLAEGRISARRVTSWGHAWDVFAIARFDLAGTLPRQRYSTMGGVGTIPTMPLRGIRGPRLLYGEASYAVPLLGLPTLGGLDAFVRASAGGAWAEGAALRIEEALAGGLAARLWDFQMEAGAAIGSAVPAGEIHVRAFFDVRVRRSARPAQMPRRGRGF